jgi:hypothetical protein
MTPDLDQETENCPEPKVDEKIAELLAVVNQIQKAPDCGPMAPGSSRLSNTSRQGPSTTRMLEGEYLLNRKADGNYEAVLNVVFNNVTGKKGPDWMRSRVESCLSIAAPYLKGPHNELLGIKLASEEELDKLPHKSRPKPFVINVYDKYPRAVATNFPEDADCSVLTHEIFHQFGLCDEYHERVITGYNCRPNNMATNLMNDNYKAFGLTVPKQLTCPCDNVCQKIMTSHPSAADFFLAPEVYELLPAEFIGSAAANCKQSFVKDPRGYNQNVRPFELQETLTSLTLHRRLLNTNGDIAGYTQITCPCNETEASCRTVKKQLKLALASNPRRSICPPSAGAPLQNLTSLDESWGKWGGGERTPTLTNGTLTFSSRPAFKSLLAPEQFNRIIGGHCADSAGVYHMCSQHAYSGSLTNECHVPAQCLDAETYRGIQ